MQRFLDGRVESVAAAFHFIVKHDGKDVIAAVARETPLLPVGRDHHIGSALRDQPVDNSLVVGRTVTVEIKHAFEGSRSMPQVPAIDARMGADIDPEAGRAAKTLRAGRQCGHRRRQRPGRQQCQAPEKSFHGHPPFPCIPRLPDQRAA